MSTALRRPRSTLPRPLFVVVSVGFVCLATAVASVAFWPVYLSAEYAVMVAVTTVTAIAVSTFCALKRVPANLVVLAAIALYLLLGVPLAVPGRALLGVLPTVDGLRDLALGTVLGWKQLLTITLPVGSFQSLLVPAFLVVLATVTGSMSAALRLRRPEFAVAGPIVLFLCGILFGPSSEFLPVATGLTLAATVLLWLVWLRLDRRRASLVSESAGIVSRESRIVGVRTAMTAVLIIAIASAGAVGATALIPPQADRDVLRSRVVQPFDPREYPSPLSGFRRYHLPDRATEPMLTVSGLEVGERIRIATLDTYDGVVYSVGSDAVSGASGSFTLVPDRFDQSGVEGSDAVVDVVVDGYRGVWLPTVGKLEQVDFSGADAARSRESFYYNDNSGTAAVIDGVGTGDAYRLTSVRPEQPGDDALAALVPGDAQVPSIGAVPEELSNRLARYTLEVDGAGPQLVAMIDSLRAEGYVSHGTVDEEPSRSGHSADRINELFSESRMIGDEEQYAVAAAIMATELGFPARVVLGFVPSDVVADGETVLVGSDISAWIEVDTTRFGWVTLDPTPPMREIPEEIPEDPTQVPRPQTPLQPPVEQPDVPDEQQPPDALQDELEVLDPLLALLLAVLQIAGWVLLAVAVILSPFIAIIAAKVRRRRRRRRAPTPDGRITGGWAEFHDAVIDHGYTVPASSTRSEFAGVIGGAQTLVLAAEADRAVFAPDGSDERDADRVWRSVDELRTALDARLSRWKRLRARVSLRSFGNSSGRGATPS